jgi:hypothetical protein
MDAAHFADGPLRIGETRTSPMNAARLADGPPRIAKTDT